MILSLTLALAGLVAHAAQEPAPVESVDALVARARELVEERRAEEAWPLFERAFEQSGGTFEARVWLLRGRIARGHLGLAFDEIDALAAAGERGPALDYLYGMALHARAKQHIEDQVEGGLIELNFGDAQRFLAAATAAEPERFGDAHLALAESAWFRQDNATARASAERALARRPKGFDEAFLLGRIAFSQYVVDKAEPERAAAADAHWQAALDAFARAVENAGRPTDALRWNELAQAHLQSAHALVWKDRRAEAAASFARALAADPSVVNCRELWTHLAPDQVLDCLKAGAAGFTELHGAESDQDATLLWWLGWAHFARGEHAEAEAAFLRAIQKFPAFADARWYIGLARYHRQDFDGAIAAMAAGFDRGADQVAGAARTDARANLAILDFLVARCQAAEPPKHLEAAALSELQLALEPTTARHASNVGLFLYLAGRALDATTDEAARLRRTELFERAFAAYERALELAPDDPGTLNDSGVVLQYGLERDLPLARARYERALERAALELARTDLARPERARLEQVVRDARANLAELERAGGR